MFRSIVVMVDRASEASGCVREAAELAERTGARLTLLAAVPPVRPVCASLWAAPIVPPETPRSLQQACERECETLLRRAAESVPTAVPVTMSVRGGRSHAVLLREVRERGHDLVVLGGGLSWGVRLARSRFLRRCPAGVLFLTRPPGVPVAAGQPEPRASLEMTPRRLAARGGTARGAGRVARRGA
jgi:nucleotide-binding universal stress UspA family protein